MTLLYSINGLALHNPAQGRKLLDATQWAGPIQMRNTVITLPGVHGSVPVWNAPLEPGSISFRVRIQGDSPAELNNRWNELVRHLGIGINQPSILVRTRSAPDEGDGQQVSVAAQLASVEPPDFFCNPGYCDATIVFSIPEGRWFGDEVDTVLVIPQNDQIVTVAGESTMPLTNMQFRCRGSISSLQVTDQISQTGFAWSGANITSTQWLLVDMQTFTAWQKDTDDWELTGTNVSAQLRSMLLGWLNLVPGIAPGSAASSVNVSASGTDGTTDCILRTRPAYH